MAATRTILLECKVSGETSLIHLNPVSASLDVPSTKLDPATVHVQIDVIGKALAIQIDGPPTYSLGLFTGTSDKRMHAEGEVNEDAYMMLATRDSPNSKLEYTVTIGRKTGAISVLKVSTNPSFTEQTQYSGTCEKMKQTGNKFWTGGSPP